MQYLESLEDLSLEELDLRFNHIPFTSKEIRDKVFSIGQDYATEDKVNELKNRLIEESNDPEFIPTTQQVKEVIDLERGPYKEIKQKINEGLKRIKYPSLPSPQERKDSLSAIEINNSLEKWEAIINDINMYKNIPNSFYHEMNKLRILNHIETIRDNLQIAANTLEITQPNEVYNRLNNIELEFATQRIIGVNQLGIVRTKLAFINLVSLKKTFFFYTRKKK